MELYAKMSFISTFFLVFKRDFVRRANFTHISASNTYSKWWRHKSGHT